MECPIRTCPSHRDVNPIKYEKSHSKIQSSEINLKAENILYTLPQNNPNNLLLLEETEA